MLDAAPLVNYFWFGFEKELQESPTSTFCGQFFIYLKKKHVLLHIMIITI